MILFIRNNCINCPQGMLDTIRRMGGQILQVIQHPDGTPYIQLEPKALSKLPPSISGLPALLTENHVYMGLNPILSFINSKKETLHAR